MKQVIVLRFGAVLIFLWTLFCWFFSGKITAILGIGCALVILLFTNEKHILKFLNNVVYKKNEKKR